MPYVVWIAAFNTSFLFLYLVIQSWANARPSARDTGAPAIFEAMNRNGLVVFLVVSENPQIMASRLMTDSDPQYRRIC